MRLNWELKKKNINDDTQINWSNNPMVKLLMCKRLKWDLTIEYMWNQNQNTFVIEMYEMRFVYWNRNEPWWDIQDIIVSLLEQMQILVEKVEKATKTRFPRSAWTEQKR